MFARSLFDRVSFFCLMRQLHMFEATIFFTLQRMFAEQFFDRGVLFIAAISLRDGVCEIVIRSRFVFLFKATAYLCLDFTDLPDFGHFLNTNSFYHQTIKQKPKPKEIFKG